MLGAFLLLPFIWGHPPPTCDLLAQQIRMKINKCCCVHWLGVQSSSGAWVSDLPLQPCTKSKTEIQKTICNPDDRAGISGTGTHAWQQGELAQLIRGQLDNA